MKKLCSFLLCLCTVFMLCACSPSEKTVLTVGDRNVSAAEFEIYYTVCYANFLATYDTDEIGFDTTTNPLDQTCGLKPTVTWGEFLLDTTVDFCRELVIVNTQAEKNGCALTDEEKLSVHKEIFGTDEEPVDRSTWSALYGEDVDLDALEKTMMDMALYRKYYAVLEKSFAITGEEINAYYEENKNTIDTVTVRMVPFEYYDKSRTAAEAKKAAQDFIASVTCEEEIYTKAQNVISDSMKKYFGTTDFTLTYNVTRDYFGTNTSAERWMFNDARQYMDTFVYDNGSMCIALFFIEKDTKDYAPVSVRHLLISDKTADGAEQASSLLDTWRKEDGTENGFASMTLLYSEDTATRLSGGLYENVYKGQMIEEVNQWIFDKSRQKGDTTVLLSSYGYHILYFVSASTETYRDMLCRSALTSSEYKAFFRGFDDIKSEYDINDLLFVFE